MLYLRRCFPVRRYRHYAVRCFLVLLILALSLVYWSSISGRLKADVIDNDSSQKAAVLEIPILKDSYNLVTAISSREFQWLLKFVDSVIIQNGQFDITVWSLDLRDCEFNFLKNLKTSVRIHLHHFPYHFYPLHIRYYHLTAIKPIVLGSAAAAFGEVIWIEPNIKIVLLLDNIIQVVDNAGFVAASRSKTSQGECITLAIGINYIRHKQFIENWLECAKTAPCIAKALNKSIVKPHPGVDMLFEQHRRDRKFSCVVMESKAETLNVKANNVLTNWERKQRELCQLHNVCVLTGNLFELLSATLGNGFYNEWVNSVDRQHIN